MTLILGIFIGATIGYITAALMAAPNYSEIPTSSTAKDILAVEEEPEISETIKHIENMRKGIYLVYPEKLYDFMIQTLRKYQKIQEIMTELNGNFYGSYLKDRQTLEKIYEVIEDGKCK